MKANKALKRLAKIEALMADMTERYSASAPHIREVLQDAKAAVGRAREAVSLQASSGTAKKAAPARKKVAVKKAARKAPSTKTAKKGAPIKKAAKKPAAKKTAPVPVQAATEATAQ
jgi:DnaK suppressor protein